MRPLTERERAVLEMLADGRTENEMAEELGVTRFTVQSHRKQLYKKLKAVNGAHAVRLGFQAGIFDIPGMVR